MRMGYCWNGSANVGSRLPRTYFQYDDVDWEDITLADEEGEAGEDNDDRKPPYISPSSISADSSVAVSKGVDKHTNSLDNDNNTTNNKKKARKPPRQFRKLQHVLPLSSRRRYWRESFWEYQY